jgi:chromosome segregation ATPase
MAIPSVIQGTVEVEGKVFELDSSKGVAWLETIGSFRFEPAGDGKPCTVRREQSGYWYGCRKVAGKVRKKYIGKTSEVSTAKLEEIAKALKVPPVARISEVAEVAQNAQVTERVAEVAEDRFTALELEVANLRKALEALQEALPGKLEPGDSAELPKVDNAVAEGLQNDLGNLKAENEKIRADYDALLESSTVITKKLDQEVLKLRLQLEQERTDREEVEAQLSEREKQIEELRSQLVTQTEPTPQHKLYAEIEELKECNRLLFIKSREERQALQEKISALEYRDESQSRRLAEKQNRLDELEAQLEQKRAEQEEVEAELAELAQLKKEVKEHAHELHREENSMKLEKARWQRELSDARAELADAKTTILNQGNKIRELERGYSLQPNPAEKRLRLEIGELRSQIADLEQKSATTRELPEAADLLNQLKTRRKKSHATLADIEVVLEMIEEF